MNLVELDEGPRLYVDADLISETIMMTGAWEWPLSELIRNELRPTDTFLDLGAHIGYFSILAAPICQTVVAIEPQIEAMELLKKSTDVNAFANIQCVCAAVGFGRGTVRLKRTLPNTGSSFVGEEGSEISAIDVSDILPGGADVIKMDIEGAEHNLLALEPWLLERPRMVFFEYAPTVLRRYGATGVDLLQHFEQFAITRLDGAKVSENSLPVDDNWYINLVARRRFNG